MTLYEIDNAIADFIANNTDFETGEITNIESLLSLEEDREKKLENIALYYKNVCAEADMVKAEKLKLAERQARLEKTAERLKATLFNALNGQAFKTARTDIRYRKSSVLTIIDATLIPSEYLIVQEPKIDKAALKTAIKGAREIQGAIVEEKQNIIIK